MWMVGFEPASEVARATSSFTIPSPLMVSFNFQLDTTWILESPGNWFGEGLFRLACLWDVLITLIDVRGTNS